MSLEMPSLKKTLIRYFGGERRISPYRRFLLEVRWRFLYSRSRHRAYRKLHSLRYAWAEARAEQIMSGLFMGPSFLSRVNRDAPWKGANISIPFPERSDLSFLIEGKRMDENGEPIPSPGSADSITGVGNKGKSNV